MLQPRGWRALAALLALLLLAGSAAPTEQSLLDSSTNEHNTHEFETESLPLERVKRKPQDVTTIYLDENGSGREGRNYNRGLGLLTSTTRTFVNDGTTTEFATQIIGTKLGTSYAHVVATSSRVIYAADSRPKSYIDNAILPPKPAAHIIFATKDNAFNFQNDLFSYIHEDDKSDKVNTDTIIESKPNHVLKSSYDFPTTEGSLNPLTIDPESENLLKARRVELLTKKRMTEENSSENNYNDVKPARVVPLDDTLPTFTVKHDFAPSGFSFEQEEDEKKFKEPSKTTRPRGSKALFRGGIKMDQKKYDTVTYHGFADFTTTVGDTVIIFMPKTAQNSLKATKQDTRIVTSVKTFMSHSPGMVTRTVTGHSLSMQTSLPTMVVDSEQSMIRENKAYPQYVSLTKNSEEKASTPSTIERENFEAKSSILSQEQDMGFTSILEPSSSIFDLTSSLLPDSSIMLEPSETSTEQITTVQATESLATFATTQTQAFVSPDAVNPLGLIKVLAGTRAYNETTTQFTSLIYGTVIDDTYSQVIHATSSVFYLEDGEKIFINPTKVESTQNPTQTISMINDIQTTTEENIPTSFTEEITTENNEVETGRKINILPNDQIIVQDKEEKPVLKPSLITQVIPSTAYKTFTYLTTFYIPAEGSSTTSIRSREVTSTEIIQVTKVVPGGFESSYSPSILKESESTSDKNEQLLPTTNNELPSTTPHVETTTEDIPLATFIETTTNQESTYPTTELDKSTTNSEYGSTNIEGEVTNPITEEINVSEVTNSNDISEPTNQGTTQDMVESITNEISETETTTVKLNKKETEANKEHTTESIKIYKEELTSSSTPGEITKEISSSIETTTPLDGEHDEIELIFKTVYTTYTYLTTFFQKTTSSVSSRYEVITNVVTTTADKEFLESPNSVVAGLFERENSEIIPTSVGIGRPTEIYTPVNNIEDTDFSTVDSIDIEAEKEKLSPTPVLDDTTPKTYYTTYTYFTTIFVDGETEIESRTEIYTNIVSPSSVEKSTLQTSLINLNENDQISEADHLESPPIISLFPSSTIKRTSEISLSKHTSQYHYNTISRSHNKPQSEFPVTINNEIIDHTNLLEESKAPISSRAVIESIDMSSSSSSKQVAVLLEDQISSESNTEEIEPSPTLLLKTSYTTFTYFTTMYKGSTSDVVSRLETITNVDTETIHSTPTDISSPSLEDSTLPITYFTTYTYWTTLFKDGSTVVTSREETISNIVTPTLASSILSTVQTESYTPLATTILESSTNKLEESLTAESEIDNSLKEGIKESENVDIPIIPTQVNEGTTYYTTYTYFTTSYIGNSTVVNSRLETITSIVNSTELVQSEDNDIQTGRAVPNGANVIQTENTKNAALLPTGLLSTLVTSEVNDKTTTLFSTDVFGTYIDGLYAKVLESTTQILTSNIQSTIAPSQVEPTMTTGVVSLNEGKIIDADSISTTYFTTKAIGTYIDNLYAQVIESSTSLVVDSDKQSLLSTNLDSKSHRTGLVRLIEGTVVKDHTTTFYESRVIGTVIEGRYAQIIESTSSFKLEMTSTSTLIEPSTVASSTLLTPTSIVPSPTPTLESSINNENSEEHINEEESNEDEEDEEEEEEDGNNSKSRVKSRLTFSTRKRTFTPVIRPFLSRNRPTFNPKRKTANASTATTITRTTLTPTITATPALKTEGFGNSRNRFASNKKQNSSQNSGLNEVRPSSSRRFSRVKSSATGGFSSSSNYRGKSSSRISPTSISPNLASSRRGGFFRSSSNRIGISSQSKGSSLPPGVGRPRIRPTLSSRLGPGATTTTSSTEDTQSDEDLLTTVVTDEPLTSSEEDIATGPISTTTEAFRRSNNPLLRFRRPPNIQAAPRSTTPRSSTTPPRRNPLRRNENNKAITTTPKPTTKRASFAFQRPRPSNNLFPRRGLLKKEEKKEILEESEEENKEENQETSLEEPASDNDYEGSEPSESTAEANRRSGKAYNPVQIRPFGFRRRTKRQSEYGNKNNQPFIPRFRRPSSRKVAQDRIDVPEETELISEAPTAKPRYTPRPRNNGVGTTKIRPTTASSNSGRSQFTLREKEPTGTTRSTSSSPSFRRSKSGSSNRRRTTAKTELPQTTIPSRPKPPRLRNQTPRTTEEPYTPRSTRRYSNNNSNNNPRTPTRSRSRSRYRQENNSDFPNFNYQPNNDGTITVTYHIPTEVTIPVVNGKITEYKNIITASLSTEVVGPLGYTSLNGKDGKDTLVLTNEISSTLPGGTTEVTHYILHTKPTTSVIFTPTTIRGRKTSFSHIIPSTVYSVEPYVSTIQPNIAANAPLANILLSQLLLGNLGGIPPNINPLLGINQPTATPASPTTEFHTKTTTYVTTVTKGTSTVVPLTFRGKEILTTIVDQSEEVITATEFITETVVITPTVQQANQQQLNSLLLPALLQAQILGNQQTQTPANPLFGGLQDQSKNVADLFAEPIRRGQPDLDQNFFDTLQNDEQDVRNDYEKNNDEPLEIISPKPKISRKKQRNQNNDKKPPDPPPEPSETSVITLYVSGRRPGEFSTVLSTVTVGEESSASIQKREVKIEASQVFDFTPSSLIEYDSNSISPFIDIGIESSETETQSLESIVGDVNTHLSTGHFLSKGPADFAPFQRKVLINTSERGNLQHRFKRNLENIEKQIDETPRRRRILVKVPRKKNDDILSNSETQRIETFNMELDKNLDKNKDTNFEKQNRKRVLVTRRRKIHPTENQTSLSQSNEDSENINSSRRRVIVTKKRTLRPSSTKRKIVKVTRKRPIQNDLSSNLAVTKVLSINETSSLNLKTLDATINFESQNLQIDDIHNVSISKNITEIKTLFNDSDNTDIISENKTDLKIATEPSTIVNNDTSNLKELNFNYSLPIMSEIESSLSEIENSSVIQETTQILPDFEMITSIENFANTFTDSENILPSTNIEEESSTIEDGPRFVRPTRFSVTRKPQRTKPSFANQRRRTSTNEYTEQTTSSEFTSTFLDISSKPNFKPKKTSTSRKFGRKSTSTSSSEKIHSTTRTFRPSSRIEEPIHSETQNISSSLSSEELFATAINSTERSSPLIFATKVITTTRLRTYTFIVTRVAGTEQLVTSTTEVRPHTKIITITESLPAESTDLIQPSQTVKEEFKTQIDTSITDSSLVLPSEEGRGLDMNASPRYNLATKIMSNGVEVIVAGDKSTLPGDPEDANFGVISSATRRAPVTLPPSTLTDHMIMYLPAHSDNQQILPGSKKFINDFVTKTYMTTITYETSLTKDGLTTVSTNKKVISNIVTEERTKVQITPTPSLGSGVTFHSSPVMATMVIPTMYTYTNVIDESGIASSTLNIENTVTIPAEYITLIEPSELGIRETNTYHTSEHNQKMTQVVVTETAQPTPVLSQIQPLTTDVTKTYFVTYTYYNTFVNNDGNTVVKSEVATSSDVFTEKFYLNQKRTTMGIEPTSTKPVQILATKTFLTTFTYLTTLLKNGKTSVSSSTSLVQNIVTETLDAAQLSSGYIESLQISFNTDHFLKQSTVVPVNNMIHSTQASSLMTSNSIKPNDIITGSTIIFFDENDQVDSFTTNNINPTMTEFAPLSSTTTSKFPILQTSILTASTIMPNGATLMPGDQIISINLPDGNITKIPVPDPGKHRPGYVIGPGGTEIEVSDILSLGSLGINAVNALSPVIDALPSYFDSNVENRRNDSISERPQPVYVPQMDIDFPPVRSPVYIPVEENKNIPDTEVAESQNYEGIVNVNENLKHWNQFTYLKHSRRPDEGDSGASTPILGNGIPISPGQVITTNSDVIVGKPSILGPRPHLAHDNIPLGMKPPPPPKSWEVGEFIEHKQNKEHIIHENSQISPQKTFHRVHSNTFNPKYTNNNPPRITISNHHQKFEINQNTHSHSDKHNNQNELLHSAEGSILIGQPPFGEHVQDHPPIIGEKRPLPLGSNLVQHNPYAQKYKPEFPVNSASTNINIFEQPIGIEPGLVINSKPPVIPIGILSKQPTPEIDGLLPPPIPTDPSDNIVHGNPVIPIKAVTPTTIDRSSGMPLLVNLQPSQITNVLIPNSETIGESLQHEETVHGVQNANHNHFNEASDTKINVNISPGQDIKVDVASNEGTRDKRPSWFNDHSGSVLDVPLQKPITLQSHNQFNKPHLPETPSNFMKPPPLPHEKRPSPVLIPLHLDLGSDNSNEEENEGHLDQESNKRPVVPVEFVQPPPPPNHSKQPSKIYDHSSPQIHSVAVGSVSVENIDNVAGESNIGFGTVGVGNIDLTHSLENKKHPGEEKIDKVVSDDMRPPPPLPPTQMTIPKLDFEMESNSPKPFIRAPHRTTTKKSNQNVFVLGLSPPPEGKPYAVTHRPNIHKSTQHPTTIKSPQTSYHFQTQTTTTPIPITTHRPSYNPRPTTQKYRPYTEIFRTTSEKYRTTAEKYRTTTERFRPTTLKPSITTTYNSLNKTTLRTRPKPIRPFIIGLLNNEQVRPTQPKPKPSNSDYDINLSNRPNIQPSSVKEIKKSSSVHIDSNDKWNLSPSISEEYEDVESKISTLNILPSKSIKLTSTGLNTSNRKTSTYTPLRSSTVSPSRIKYHHSSDLEDNENYEAEVVTGTHKPELINKISKKVEKTQSLPTRYITHTQTLTVTTTETTVISSAGQKPSTMTLVMTKTHTSTIIDTVTHTLLRPTSIVATVTTTVSASHHPILNEENDEQEGESFFVVVNDHKLSNINLNTKGGNKEILTADGIDGEEIIANVDEGDNSNEVNQIIQGGVLLALPPRHNGESCKPDCSPARNEQCHRVAGQLRCVCRPGFARMFPDRPCMPTYTYSMKLLLARQGPTKLRYTAVMKSLGKFTQSTKEGLDRLVMQSELRDIYHGVAITQFDPVPDERDAVLVNYYVQLSENIEDQRLSEVFKTSLRTNNYSLGGTDLYADKSLQLVAEDFDECISKQFHDCSENAQCFNLRGTYTCSCQEGHTDLSENPQFPGRVCSAEMIGCERCNFHGTCYNRGEDQEMCECFQWYAGENCHINLKALLIALVTLGAALLALLLLCTIMTCVRRGQPTSRGRPVTVIRRPHKRLLRYRAGVAVGGGGGGGGSSRMDQRAMIQAGDSSSEASFDNAPISYMQPISPPPPALSSLSSKLKKAPVSSIGVVKPTPTLCFAPDQRDRSLTVMIPRAKYRPAPQPPGQPPPAPPPMATFSVDQLPRPVTAERKLIAYLEQQPPPGRRRAAAQAAAAAAAAAAANTTSGDQAQTTITSPKRKVTIPGERDPSPKKSPSRKASSGALVSAGFEVSATVGRKSAPTVADATNTMLSNGSNMTTLRTTDSSIVKEPLDDDSLIEAPATGLQELTVSEARSFDETTVQPPTKCVHANYNHDEADTMAERDLGSTFLLPHTQLYKPDKGSDVSNFDSL